VTTRRRARAERGRAPFRDGKTLLLLVVDGRRRCWSVGVTLPQLARLMIEAGA
jgi:exopolysaccharide biosynthesis protein